MSFLQVFFLGVLQGTTEFLPVSSSGHLVLVPWLLRWDSPGLAFDAVVHWGTAVAVIVYFWRDWVTLIGAALRSLWGLTLRSLRVSGAMQGSAGRAAGKPWQGSDSRARLLWLILLGTLPAVLAGWLLEGFFEGMFDRPVAAASLLLVTAALLVISERMGRRKRELDELTWRDALVIGVGQALAILPGISRSGATIASGLVQGLRRESAAHFSFLLATPIILGAGLRQMAGLIQRGVLLARAPVLTAGFVTAGVVGFACIHFLLRYLQRRRLYPFAAYCASLAVVCLLVALLRVD